MIPSLTFRRSCREGICGSCAMFIDGSKLHPFLIDFFFSFVLFFVSLAECVAGARLLVSSDSSAFKETIFHVPITSIRTQL